MTRQSRLTGRAFSASALLCLSLALGAATGPAAANKVGVAAAVNPDAFSSLAGAPKSQLNIGKSIFYNERIATTTSGLVQVLLVDGSTFTVGPDSDLVIDKFVYDPNKGTGQIAASFSKGVMRFVGGKISKSDNAVTINTPAGAMAVRGCIILTQVTPSSFAAVLVYGDYLRMKNFVVYEPGNGLFISATGNAEVRKATTADIGGMTAALSSSNQNNNSGNDSSKTTTGTALQMFDTASLNELIQNANTQEVVADSTQVEVPEIQQVTARVLTPPGVYFLEDGKNIPVPADNGILGGGTYAEGATPPLADDFEWTFNVSEGRFTGTVSGLTDAELDCSNGQTCSPANGTSAPATVDFPWFEPNQNTGPCVNGVCEVTDATLTQNGETETLTGTAVSKPGFFSYQLINTPAQGSEDSPEPVLLFGGEAYSLPTEGTGQLREFQLTADAKESGAAGPFMSSNSSPVLSEDSPSGTVTPLMMLDKDPGAGTTEEPNTSRRVWLQSSFSMEDSGPNQQSSVNVALGTWDPETGLAGERRGGSHVSHPCGTDCTPSRESYAFTGDIASLEGPEGSHFMGTDNPNIVVGLDSTSTRDIGRDAPLDPDSTPIENQVGATYHVGVGGDPTTPTQTLQGEKRGYAAGMVESKSGVEETTTFVNPVASTSSDDLKLEFDQTTNTLQAGITVHDVQNGDGATDSYTFGFGDDLSNSAAPGGRSSYIDNQRYAAIEDGTSEVTNSYYALSTDYPQHPVSYTYENSNATSYFVSGDQLGVTKYFPETFGNPDANGNPPPFCTDCEFIEWGAWGSRVEFGNNPENPYVDDVHLGWWVAGDITTDEQLAALAEADKFMGLGPTATYKGNVIGDVAYNPDGNGWTTYTATGKMEMDWNFNHRQGELRIKNFDTSVTPGGLNFSGPMCAPGNYGCGTRPGNHFGGPLNTVQPVGNDAQLPSNLANISGSATGSFVNDGPDRPAAGAIGNWNVSNSMNGAGGYKATGVFAGRRGPGPN
jgi:hypothetical protein